MDKFAILFRKEVIKGPEFQIFAYLDGIINTYSAYSKFLFPTYYCVKQNNSYF